jgi:autotransporter passenger strand-loop-strand repeat protein
MTITVSSGVTSTSLTISAGDPLVVLSGGAVISTTVLNGASATLSAGATASRITISAGGELLGAGDIEDYANHDSLDYGLVSGVTVGDTSSEAHLFVESGGVASSVMVVDNNSTEYVHANGHAFGTVLISGGHEVVADGGHASGTVVSANGDEIVSSGGFDSGTVVFSLGTEDVFGVASGTMVNSGGTQDVLGIASGTVVRGGYENVDGVTAGTVVSSGGYEYVDDGGNASGTAVTSGGYEIVSGGGHASGTVVSAGGYEYVDGSGYETSGGVASGTVLRGGEEFVSSGGLAVGTVGSSGGTEVVSKGGVVSGLFLSSGGSLVDDGAVRVAAARTFRGAMSGSGALAVLGSGDLVLSGDGSAFAGSAVINGGTIELATSGAIGSGGVVFGGGTGSHTLQIDAPAAGGTFANVISNFSGTHDFIDLRGLAYVAGASATVSGGVLTLSDGGHTYKFDLAGAIGSAGTLYPVTSDGHGGTLIDPRVATFAQAAAAFSPTAAGPLSPISSGGARAHAVMAAAAGSAGGHG